MEIFNKMIASALNIAERQVNNTLSLLNGGATIPFISRYRKEATGGLDEVQIGEIKERYDKLTETAKRKETILKTIEEQGKLTAELKKRIEACWDATELEDIYLPYKPKRKTRAEAARQKGLEPLATILMMQRENNLMARVRTFVKGEVNEFAHVKGYLTKDEINNKVTLKEHVKEYEKEQYVPIETAYKPITIKNGYTYLEVELITGKTHQIRAHLSSKGHPLLGDEKYGDRNWNRKFEEFKIPKWQLLHSYRVEFPQMDGEFADISGCTFVAKEPELYHKLK